MSPGREFSERFAHYLPPGEDEIKAAMTTGTVVPDTSILLDAYRLAPEGRRELISILTKVADRTWIPHQVTEEYHRNRLAVITGRDSEYTQVITALKSAQASLNEDVTPKLNLLAKRTALPAAEHERIQELIAHATAEAITAIERLKEQHANGETRTSDAILATYQQIYAGKIGEPFEQAEHEKARNEAQRRAQEEIPPGYRDKEKADPSGDYLIWAQILRHAATRRPLYLLFITSDTKEDWYLRIRNQTVCARPELAKELAEAAGSRLVMMSLPTFLNHAHNHLNEKVSDETIRQSQSLTHRTAAGNVQGPPLGLIPRLRHLRAYQHEAEADLARIDKQIDFAREHVASLTAYKSIRRDALVEAEEEEKLRQINELITQREHEISIATATHNNIAGRHAAVTAEIEAIEDTIDRVI